MRHWPILPPKALSLLAFYLIFACALPATSPAKAEIIHHPRFKIEAMVIVWNGSSDQLAPPRSTAKTGQSLSLETAIPVISAELIPLPSAQAYDQPVPLRDSVMGTTVFYVASNSGFSIDAELSDTFGLSLSELENLEFSMSAHLGSPDNPSIGQKAQFAHTGGAHAGFTGNVATLADLRSRRTVFRGNRATAAERGTIAEQSVRFETVYRGPQNLATTAMPDIILTVFVP